jgi:hypothetical protein
MEEEKSDEGEIRATEPPNRRQGPRRTLDVVIVDDQRREERRKSAPGWKTLLERIFGRG